MDAYPSNNSCDAFEVKLSPPYPHEAFKPQLVSTAEYSDAKRRRLDEELDGRVRFPPTIMPSVTEPASAQDAITMSDTGLEEGDISEDGDPLDTVQSVMKRRSSDERKKFVVRRDIPCEICGFMCRRRSHLLWHKSQFHFPTVCQPRAEQLKVVLDERIRMRCVWR